MKSEKAVQEKFYVEAPLDYGGRLSHGSLDTEGDADILLAALNQYAGDGAWRIVREKIVREDMTQ